MSSAAEAPAQTTCSARALLDLSSLPGGRLATHQQEALAWLSDHPVALLADATGSGKTAVACGALALAFEREHAARAVWVTEAHLIPQTLRELGRFLPTLTAARWPGAGGDQIRVVSVETLTRQVDALAAWSPHVAVVDEASSVKGAGREPAAVKRVFSRTRRRLGLTATPVELDATEGYRLLRLLGAPDLPAQGVFESLMDWQDLPFGQARPYATKPDAVQVVRSVFAKYVLCRGVDELGLVLPDLQEETLCVALTPAQQRSYDRASSERSPLAQATKREKACAYVGGRSAKAEHAVAWLLAHPRVGKAVIFAEHLGHLSLVERLLDAAGIGWARIDGTRNHRQRAAATDAFRSDPRIRVLLGTKVLERGIDGLQHCGVMVSLGSSYNPAREAQRIGRLRRPGSPHPAVRHVTFTSDTEHEKSKHATVRRRLQEARSLTRRLTSEGNGMPLSEAQIHCLSRTRPWLPPLRSPYGSPLHEVVSVTGDMEFLQDAIRAGHLPDLDGIELAMNAYFLFVEAEARVSAHRGRLDFARSWTETVEDYRRLAATLTAEADRLEAVDQELQRPVT